MYVEDKPNPEPEALAEAICAAESAKLAGFGGGGAAAGIAGLPSDIMQPFQMDRIRKRRLVGYRGHQRTG